MMELSNGEHEHSHGGEEKGCDGEKENACLLGAEEEQQS
jgi:hypothetical protein